ncbi:hypothetical protein I6A84_44020 [Frankia sp. CNm7]|uniref:DUF4878 domain-containing protein n=1 Tax=Frankia nepalensis TaxID=1836974 RepID=A0A937RTS5_9ACTN|nr:hypothetical protein [Frankia nepalensis]MBL7495922.1 hypothetical protein [Frankia nepalensis]MBL7513848.1 hypothetical protein [Frankia nepalensis]MBL7524826.1 hypothetical protein [Frankia nepalensis]MBL7632648.1 hypothetical protein [Frankia nepalensis]
MRRHEPGRQRPDAYRYSVRLLPVVVLLVAACSGGHDSDGGGPSGPSPSASPSTAPPLTQQQGSALSTRLASGSEDDLRSAMGIPPGQVLDPAALAGLREAGPVSFDMATFQPLDATHATVVGRFAHPPAGQPAAWTFLLAWSDGSWTIVATEPVR